MKDAKRRRRRSQIAKKAQEMVDLYVHDAELTAFTAIDGDDVYDPGGNLADSPNDLAEIKEAIKAVIDAD